MLELDCICHISGIFTVPVFGIWKVSFSLQSRVLGKEENIVWLYHNNERVTWSLHKTRSNNDEIYSTGGREIILDAQEEDTINLGTTTMERDLYEILLCLEYYPS